MKRQIPEHIKLMVREITGPDFEFFKFNTEALFFFSQAPYHEAIYKWLIVNHVTGRKFFEFLAERRFSHAQALLDIRKMAGIREYEGLFVGKDLI